MTRTEQMLCLFGWDTATVGEFDRRGWNVAAYAEQRNGRIAPDGFPLWDRTAADLAPIHRYGPDGPLKVPEWWALPWVVEDMLRLEENVHDSLKAAQQGDERD